MAKIQIFLYIIILYHCIFSIKCNNSNKMPIISQNRYGLESVSVLSLFAEIYFHNEWCAYKDSLSIITLKNQIDSLIDKNEPQPEINVLKFQISQIERYNYNTSYLLDSSLLIFEQINNKYLHHSPLPLGSGATCAYMACIKRENEKAEKIASLELNNLFLANSIDSLYKLKLLIIKAYSIKQQGWTYPERVKDAYEFYNQMFKYYLSLSINLQHLTGPSVYFEYANYAVHLNDSLLLNNWISEYNKIYRIDIKPFNTNYLKLEYYNKNNLHFKSLIYCNKIINSSKNPLNVLTSYQLQSFNYMFAETLINLSNFKLASSIINKEIIMKNGNKQNPYKIILIAQLFDLYYSKFTRYSNQSNFNELQLIFKLLDKSINQFNYISSEFTLLYFYKLIDRIYNLYAEVLINKYISPNISQLNEIHSILNKYKSLALSTKEVNHENLAYADSLNSILNISINSAYKYMNSGEILFEYHKVGDNVIRFNIGYDKYIGYQIIKIDSTFRQNVEMLNNLLELKNAKYDINNIKKYYTIASRIYLKVLDNKILDGPKYKSIIFNLNDSFLLTIPYGAICFNDTLSNNHETWPDLPYVKNKYKIIYTPSYNRFISKRIVKNNTDKISDMIIVSFNEDKMKLTNAKKEVFEIESIFCYQDIPVKIMSYKEFKSQINYKNKYIHIIGHGQGTKKGIFESKVISTRDTFNYEDILKSDFSNSIISLSMCESNNGRYFSREGSYSLANAFLRSNAQMVISISNEIPDYYSRIFFTSYYQLNNRNINFDLKINNFNNTNDSRFEHPAFWSKIYFNY